MAAGICHIPALCFFFQKTKGTLAAALISPNNAACKTKADSIAIYLKRKSIFKLVTASTKIMTENVKKYTFAIYAQDFPYNSHTLPSCAAKTKVKPSPCPLSILRTLCTNTSKASSQFCRNADPSLARPIADDIVASFPAVNRPPPLQGSRFTDPGQPGREGGLRASRVQGLAVLFTRRAPGPPARAPARARWRRTPHNLPRR